LEKTVEGGDILINVIGFLYIEEGRMSSIIEEVRE